MNRFDRSSRKLYIGGLPFDIREYELKDEFGRYGRINEIWVAKNGFAFVEYDDRRDAADALHDLDGIKLFGGRIRVEFSRRESRDNRDRRFNSDRRSEIKCYNCNMFGHMAKDCPRPQNKGECYNCGELGHKDAFCPKKKQGSNNYRSRSRSRSSHRHHSRSRSTSSRSPSVEPPHKSASPSPQRYLSPNNSHHSSPNN